MHPILYPHPMGLDYGRRDHWRNEVRLSWRWLRLMSRDLACIPDTAVYE